MHKGHPFPGGSQDLIDSVRVLYVLCGTMLFFMLGWRAGRWLKRHREPAWLHLATMFLCAATAHVGYTNLGNSLTPVFPLNLLGLFCAVMFITKTPPENLDKWREERGDPPDWDLLFSRTSE